ncbi:MAG: hypothetical protein HYR96_15305 [Deltaproteobacteria bacterium]|nr:hypothetical protein [Deltaproteobacteria bacterium]MBI3296239.1 hypothetical protein [Deltaproteobacteria bacterium]
MKHIYYLVIVLAVAACKTDPDALFGGGVDPENQGSQNPVTEIPSCALKLTWVEDNNVACERPDLDSLVYSVEPWTPPNGVHEILWKFRKMPTEKNFPSVKQVEFVRDTSGEFERRWGDCIVWTGGSADLATWKCRLFAINKSDEGRQFRISSITVSNDNCGRIVRYEATSKIVCSHDQLSLVSLKDMPIPSVVTETPNYED